MQPRYFLSDNIYLSPAPKVSPH